MAKNTHLFIIDPIERLNLELDSSLRLAFALSKHGQSCFFCHRQDLFWKKKDRSAAARVRPFEFAGTPSKLNLDARYEELNLAEFSSIQMRLEPPFDLAYVATTWLLDSVSEEVLVVNHPNALRRYNEKLAILSFPEDCDEALVSSQPEQILDFIKTHCRGDAIIKPLDMYGGRGVTRLEIKEQGQDQSALTKLEELCHKGTQLRLIQPFNHAIYEGEVRVFAVGGAPVAWCLKVPAKGSFMANTREGAQLKKFSPPKELATRIAKISQRLWQDGIAFVGFDIIGNFVSEINITSPRLLAPPGEDEAQFYDQIAKWLLAQTALKGLRQTSDN